jgi:uncharacterized protein with PIN domain
MGGVNAVIDVSNVCWDEQLPPRGRRRPVWRRLQLVMTAWRAQYGPASRFQLVADDSLVHDLDEARDYGRLLGDGTIVVKPVADTEVLDLAERHGLHVLTRDHYLDHRRRYPWIEGSPDRFHRWKLEHETVRIVALGITSRPPQDLSRAVEIKDLRQLRLDPHNPRYRTIIETRWRCVNTHCPENAHWQAQLLVLPKVTARGEPRCPTCGGRLDDLGRRERLHEIVVEQRSGAEIMRFPAESGSPLVVGRGLSLKGVNLQVDGLSLAAEAIAAIERVSRRHLTLTVQEPAPDRRRMVVTDLDSRNGTTVEHPPGAGKPTVVRPGESAYAMEKDWIVLGDAVTLRLSGKKYLTSGSHPVPVAARRPERGGFGSATTTQRTDTALPGQAGR